MKRFLTTLCIITLAVICVLALPNPVEAASESDLAFGLNEDGESYSVTGCDEAASGELVIPATYNDLPVTGIGDYAFRYCTSLTSVTIPDSVTSIGEYAFYNCSSLTGVTIGSGVTSVGDFAFAYCTNLTSINIPHSVTSIGDSAFDGCASLNGIRVDSENPNYSSDSFGVLFNKDQTELIQAPGGISGAYTIPDSVTSIGDGAFESCESLTNITIPDSVTSVGDGAFCGCTGLTGVTIGNGVTGIGEYAFCNCTNLTSITIPDSVTSIGASAFECCTSLTSITIPDSVTTISDSAFYSCTSLTNVYYGGSKEQWNAIAVALWNDELLNANITFLGEDREQYLTFELNEDGESYSVTGCDEAASGELVIPATYNELPVTGIGEYVFYNCTSLTSVTIPDSVTSIGNSAFYNCTSLTSITIPDCVTSISDFAFSNCTSLTSVTIGSGVTSIGAWAFDYCTSLTGITIPDSVTSIDVSAFNSCTSLTSVTIPDSVTSIGDFAFYSCSGLTDVYYGGSKEQWNAITMGHYNGDLLNATVHFPDLCASGHSWDAGAVTESATCKETGVKTYTCTVCSDTKTETIAKLTTHSYKTTTTEATLTENGSIVKKCTVCGKMASTTTIQFAETFTLSATSYTYNGSVRTPTVTVKDSAGNTLVKDTDYTVTYASGRKTVGTYTVTVKGKGNYSFTKTLTFKINPASLGTCKLSATSYTYNGKVKTPTVTVKNASGATLTKDVSYTVTYASGRKTVGTYKVTIKGKGNYTGTKTLTFKINPASLGTCKLSATSYTYNGKVKTPTVTVKNASGATLTKDASYTVTYASGRKTVGTYKVTIKGKGNYTGTKTLTFKIVPKAPSVNTLTAKTKALSVKLNKQTTQTSGYEIQYATNKSFTSAKTATITSTGTTTKTLSNLKAKTTYYVRVRAYKSVSGVKIYSGWSAAKYMKTK